MALPLGGINAIAVEALPDGTVLLLESDPLKQFSTIYRFRYGQQIGNPVSLQNVLDILAPADRHGSLYGRRKSILCRLIWRPRPVAAYGFSIA